MSCLCNIKHKHGNANIAAELDVWGHRQVSVSFWELASDLELCLSETWDFSCGSHVNVNRRGYAHGADYLLQAWGNRGSCFRDVCYHQRAGNTSKTWGLGAGRAASAVLRRP